MSDWPNPQEQYVVNVDPTPRHVAETARSTRDAAKSTGEAAKSAKETRELIEQLVQHAQVTADAAEVRERQMLRWTQAGVALAAIAAVAAIVAIVVTVIVGG